MLVSCTGGNVTESQAAKQTDAPLEPTLPPAPPVVPDEQNSPIFMFTVTSQWPLGRSVRSF